MRIYEHYRARALWNMAHPAAGKGTKVKAPSGAAKKKIEQTFTLKKTRDA